MRPEDKNVKKSGAPAKPGDEMLRVELQQRFEESVKGRIGVVNNTRFESTIPGVDNMLTITPRAAAGKEPTSMNVVVGYTGTDGKRKSSSLTLGSDGSLIGRLDRELDARGVRPIDVLEELMFDLEQLNLKKWHVIEGLGLQAGKFEDIFAPEQLRGEPTEGPAMLDAERLKNLDLLLRQPDALFGLKGEQALHEGDHTIVFSDFLIIENPRVNHAAYFMDIPHMDPKDVPTGKEEFRAWIESQPWLGLLKGTRADLRKLGASRTFHSGEWKDRMLEEMDKRRKKEAPK